MRRFYLVMAILISSLMCGCASTGPYNAGPASNIENLKLHIENLKLQINRDPQDGWAHYHLCEAYIHNYLYKEAAEPCQKASRATYRGPQVPNASWLFNALGVAYFMIGQTDEAIASTKKSIALDPGNWNYFRNLASFYIKKKQYEEAITAAKRAIELNPDDADSHNELGTAYGLEEKYTEAISALKMSIRLNPSHPSAYINLGYNFQKRGNYNEAVQAYVDGIKQGVDLKSHLAILYYRMGKYDEAIATATLNSDAEILGIRSLSYRQKGDLDKAAKDAKAAMEIAPSDSTALMAQGAVLLDRGQYDEAIQLFAKFKDYPRASMFQATALAKKGRTDEAVQVYLSIPDGSMSEKNVPRAEDRQALLKIFKPVVKAHMEKAKSFEAKNMNREALSALSEALKMADDSDAQAIQEGMFNVLKNNPLLAEVPEEGRKYALRAELLIKDGNFSEAATEYKKAIRIAPYVPRLYYNCAQVSAETKNYPEAIRYMKTYLKIAADAPDARKAKDEIIMWEFMMEKGK